ncbi:MAG: hypothetical protein ACRYFS_26550 [Janthinobacterium lividum]
MTILLEPAIEARLRERAAQDGQNADTMANALLANALQMEETEKEKLFEQSLLASGLVKRLAPPRDPRTADRPLIEVQGKPVSETIIEERR